jgi:hypothetical protein
MSGEMFILPVGWELYSLACHIQMISYLILDLPKSRTIIKIMFAIYAVVDLFLCTPVIEIFLPFLAGTTEMVRSENC